MAFSFEILTAGRIVFGCGSLQRVPELVKSHGDRAMVLMGIPLECAAPLLEQLKISRIEYRLFHIHGEPTVNRVCEATEAARDFRPHAVIGLGGGSAVDAAKATAALAVNPGEPIEYLEVIGCGRPLAELPLPCIAVPTTAGTGSEVTKNAVLLSQEHRLKVSMRHEHLLPKAAVIDPQMTLTVPPQVTAFTGLDAVTQLIEPMVSLRANPFVDALCRQGLKEAVHALPAAFADGNDLRAREAMSFAALCGGFALANAGLGAVHGFAGVIGGMFPAPHGAVCARLLPLVMKANIRALQQREPRSPALEAYRQIAVILTADPEAAAEQGCEWIQDFCGRFSVPPLSAYGMTPDEVSTVVSMAMQASSMKGNPVKLTNEELTDILLKAL